MITIDTRVPDPDTQRALEQIQLGLNAAASPPIVTALPTASTSPVRYQTAAMAAMTPPVTWLLAYDGTKWCFLGGNALFAAINNTSGPAAGSETTSNTGYAALTTAGPSLTLPAAGDYDIELGCLANNAGGSWLMSYDIGATGAVDTDCIWGNGSTYAVSCETKRKTGLTAVTLTAKYKVSAGTMDARHRWMRATPVRVG